MKKIKILFDTTCEEITDEDDTNREEYSKNLTSLLISGNIITIETTSCSMILRPSKIIGIKVTEEVRSTEVKKNEQEDIITD